MKTTFARVTENFKPDFGRLWGKEERLGVVGNVW